MTRGNERELTDDREPTNERELTLDPDDWEQFRGLARRMLDDMIDHLASLRRQPAWQPVPEAVRARLAEPLPLDGQGDEAAYRDFREQVLPYPSGNLHPRFWGWVQGTGTPLGMMADMLAAGMNAHLAGFNQAPALVEAQVIRWLAELMGYPAAASGLLVLGGTMANVLGLAVARNARAGLDVREHGLAGARLAVYASTEVHSWIYKGMELLGLGRAALRRLPVDADFRVDVDAMAARLREDRRQGVRPLCIVGTAGTVNSGATDDLERLGALARDEGVWLHVDGAFGALARWSEKLRPIVAGIEAADSVAFDLHKWMYQPFDVACLLVRDGAAHRAAFAGSASYLTAMERGTSAGGMPFADLGVDLTRGFRALKVWMSLKAHGVRTFARLIEQNVAQARALAARVAAHPELELLAPAPLNIVCFRFVGDGSRDDDQLNQVNREVLMRLQESGVAVPSSTQIGPRFALRCAIVNHRSTAADFDALVEGVLGYGRAVLAERG